MTAGVSWRSIPGSSADMTSSAPEPASSASESIGRAARSRGRGRRGPVQLELCSLLDIEPKLGDGLTEDERTLAAGSCRNPLTSVRAGTWTLAPRPDRLGFLIVDGIVCRELALVDRRSLELLGAGDVVSPICEPEWPQLGGEGCVTAVTDVLAMALDTGLIQAAARWPSVLVALQRRIDAQRTRLSIQALIVHLPRADQRLLFTLWHLASRWGRVTPHGVVIPLQLTHDLLGKLIAARRSTVTLAVRRGERDGWLTRREDGLWVLTGEAEALTRTLGQTRSAPSSGHSLMLRQRANELITTTHALQASARQAGQRSPRR